MRIITQASWFVTFWIFDARFEGNWSRKLNHLCFLQPSWKLYWWRINCIWSVIPFINIKKKGSVFSVVSPKKMERGEALLWNMSSDHFPPGAMCVQASALAWPWRKQSPCLQGRWDFALPQHLVPQDFLLWRVSIPKNHMKHPLNQCSMHKIHVFSHSGEPVWYIEILRCMQIQSFLRISTSYLSARRLFPNVKPTVLFLPTRSYGRCGILLVSWQNSLGYKSEPDENYCNKNPMLSGFNGSNHVLD